MDWTSLDSAVQVKPSRATACVQGSALCTLVLLLLGGKRMDNELSRVDSRTTSNHCSLATLDATNWSANGFMLATAVIAKELWFMVSW